MIKKFSAGLITGLLMLGGVAKAENEATYNASAGVLNIPKVAVDFDYYNVNMRQQGQGLDFSVTTAVPSTSSSSSNIAAYSARTGTLNIPTVVVGADSYTVDMVQGQGLNFSVTGAQIAPPSTVIWQGREWQQRGSASTIRWDEADAYCEALTDGGHDDWTLPSQDTLRSLVVCSNGTIVTAMGTGGTNCGTGSSEPYTSPSIDPSFTCQPDLYWSSDAYPPIEARDGIIFAGGYSVTLVDGDAYVRCVRGGQ